MTVHLGLCLLVVVNLAFVHITGVVDVAWVLAFCALTVLAPFLRGCTRTALWGAAWNATVIALFFALVHRTLTQGVGRMLEGGLLLAVFCQVHLVNNLGTRQRPDLLLFNSFLIALITSFFCQQVAYCAVFVVYAVTLLVVWRLIAHRDAGGSAPLRAVVGDGVRHALAALGVTAALFLFWPRDFEREGLVGEHLMQAQSRAGVAEDIALSRPLAPLQSDKVVLRIHGHGEVPALWRGCTYRLLQRATWRATQTAQDDILRRGAVELATDVRWRGHGRGEWRRPGEPLGAPLRVELFDPMPARLFLPADATELRVAAEHAGVPHLPMTDGTFAWFAADADERITRVEYVVQRGALPAPAHVPGRRLDAWLGLDHAELPPQAIALAREVRATLPADAGPLAIARALCDRLRAEFHYGLPGHAGSARNLHEFFDVRRGHCEFFASALAIMLRCERVACRLVSGFLASEREDEDTVVVRERHAHAWVEVWDDEAGWCSFDPTPPQEAGEAGTGWLAAARAWAEAAWAAVTGFDAQRRAAALRWLLGLPAAIASRPWLLALLVALAVLAWRRRRPNVPAAVVAYARAVRAARLRRAPGETPRQLLDRAAAIPLPPHRLARLAEATVMHERCRYRGG